MKKLTLALFIIVTAGYAGSDIDIEELSRLMNEIDSPVLMESLLVGRTPAERAAFLLQHPENSTYRLLLEALRKFITIQNSDGSFGVEGHKQLSTAFCLISFCRMGESSGSKEFGEAITKAHAWLIASSPKTDPERVVTAIALSDYFGMNAMGDDPSADQILKIRECVNAISPECDETWRDLLTFTRLPEGISPREKHKTFLVSDKKYLSPEPVVPPSTLEDYLHLTLTSYALFRIDPASKKFSKWYREYNIMMKQKQDPDGFFPCKPAGDSIAATGLSIMSLTVYYAYMGQFMP